MDKIDKCITRQQLKLACNGSHPVPATRESGVCSGPSMPVGPGMSRSKTCRRHLGVLMAHRCLPRVLCGWYYVAMPELKTRRGRPEATTVFGRIILRRGDEIARRRARHCRRCRFSTPRSQTVSFYQWRHSTSRARVRDSDFISCRS